MANALMVNVLNMNGFGRGEKFSEVSLHEVIRDLQGSAGPARLKSFAKDPK